MATKIEKVQEKLAAFDFVGLFTRVLLWNQATGRPWVVDLKTLRYLITPVAEIGGMLAVTCIPELGHPFPDYSMRRKIEKDVTKTSYEHIIIFTNAEKTYQIWQWVRRASGCPNVYREAEYREGQSGLALVQKIAVLKWNDTDFTPEGDISITTVIDRVTAALDVDRVTKRFYERFKKEHNDFLMFIKNIPNEDNGRWYASVMLNRLMFIYFVQKKGFLDNNLNYLRNKLETSKLKEKDIFYRHFLRPLFFNGFACLKENRTLEVKKLLGDIPYLDGGLFWPHETELSYPDIQISDAAFDKVFDFFDEYHWHLDDRPLQNGNEINPDVLGYIFEKYINQRQMGAYYTKEDITDYISKNTIIPSILEATEEHCKIAFNKHSSVWKLLSDDPDRYIYKVMRKGVDKELPSDIDIGIRDVLKREKWNSPAPDEYALATETWREVINRRIKYEKIRAKMSNGDVFRINDLVTYNLDIRCFAQDVIEHCEGPELLRAIWNAIRSVSILDPTCGSGAFLFAALNVLEPLYEACLVRMEAFLGDIERSQGHKENKAFCDFREVIEDVANHRNRQYYIYKSIMVNNLFGVDIMKEAVEICKLRLFLKLVAQVNRVEDIEPLPDIDFNIRSGNTLVGFASRLDVQRKLSNSFDFDGASKQIILQAMEISRLSGDFRKNQTQVGALENGHSTKDEISQRLRCLQNELNSWLAVEYGRDPQKKKEYESWLNTAEPFHWFIEFYNIMQQGGFDIIIGNPPYVNLNKVDYSIRTSDYTCLNCNDLFALVTERCFSLLSKNGRLGVIIPLSATSTDTMTPLKKFFHMHSMNSWISYYSASDQPASLFSGVRHRLLILLLQHGCPEDGKRYSTRFLKWFSIEREYLFQSMIEYSCTSEEAIPAFCKLSGNLAVTVFNKTKNFKPLQNAIISHGSSRVYYHNAPVHWGKVFDFIPFYKVGDNAPQQSSHVKVVAFSSRLDAATATCLLNSSFFYWYNWIFSNCRDLTNKDIGRVPVGTDIMDWEIKEKLLDLNSMLMKSLRENSRIYKRVSKGITTQFDSFYPALSKHIIDEIDRTLAKHFGLSDEELDFIINYDLKYRVGLGGLVADEIDED